MHKQIFINLAVADLSKSTEFFRKLGYGFNERFTDDTSACVVLADNLMVMLLSLEKFKSFTKKNIVDAHQATEVMTALVCESREAVDELIKKAVAAGGSTYKQPVDFGFMYGHGFADLDGHLWEAFWMDVAKLPKKQG